MTQILPLGKGPEVPVRYGSAYVNVRPGWLNPYVAVGCTVEGQALTCSVDAAADLYAALGEALADPAVAAMLADPAAESRRVARRVASLGETVYDRSDEGDPASVVEVDGHPLGRAAA